MLSHGFASGKHLLLDMFDARISKLTDESFIEKSLREAAAICGATVLNSQFHHFGENQGITGVVLLAESHISIHTWPENQFAAVDLFMCGTCDPQKAITPLKEAFEAHRISVSCHERGFSNSERDFSVSEREISADESSVSLAAKGAQSSKKALNFES